ncbi:MAG: hypothetical protein ABI760_20685 [Ferruginibacter sp.]
MSKKKLHLHLMMIRGRNANQAAHQNCNQNSTSRRNAPQGKAATKIDHYAGYFIGAG